MAVDVPRSSFFPDIYNDDWFFMLDPERGLRPVTGIGCVTQYPYDPFRNPDRARSEELGDVLAEGIYWVLDQGRLVQDADIDHWTKFLAKRKRFIEQVLRMVERDDLEPGERARRIAALRGSLGRLARITPSFCHDFLQAWASDHQTWQGFVAQLPACQRRGQAVRQLRRDDTDHAQSDTHRELTARPVTGAARGADGPGLALSREPAAAGRG